MKNSDLFSPLSDFVFSVPGALTLLFLAGVFAFLWSTELKRYWQDRVERKKWEHWNGSRARNESEIKRPESSFKQ